MALDLARTMFPSVDSTPSLLDLASTPFFLSFVGLIISFHLLAPFFPNPKKTSWILSSLSSAAMSLASLPFLWDYLSSGGSVKHVRALPAFAEVVNRFFQAYLAADLTIGTIYYRSRISFLEGWIHHTVYILVVELAIRRSWMHIFCLGGSMEIPTFILGITILYPRLRNNILFAVSFFMTRILLHIILAISYFPLNNRIHTTGGSFIPAILLTIILPLHVMWFTGCVKGFIRRAGEKSAGQAHQALFPVVALNITPSLSNSTIVTRPTKLYDFPFPPSIPSRFPRLRLSHRRQAFGKVLRSFRLDFPPQSKRALVSRAIWAYVPGRETVYDYVGLGRQLRHRFNAMNGLGAVRNVEM